MTACDSGYVAAVAGSPRAALLACLRPQDRLAVIHSSLPHLKPPPGVGKWQLLRALRALADRGITVAIPAFTLGFGRGETYDPRRSPSEMGVLGDWMRELAGAVRTPHPIYSYVVLGPLAEEIAACANTTTFGDDSTFAYFERADARYVMLGCGFDYCSQFHRYEEEARVPYRYFKTLAGTADYGPGPRPAEVRMFVRDIDIGAENDWSDIVATLHEARVVKRVPLWGGMVEAASCSDIAIHSRRLLAADPLAMAHDRPRVRVACERLAESRAKPPFRIALLGSSNLDMLKTRVAEAMAEAVGDRRSDIYTVPYGQVFRELADPQSALQSFKADFTLFCDRIEDLAAIANLDFAATANLDEKVRLYAEAIVRYRAGSSGWIFVASFAATQLPFHGAADDRQATLIARLNGVLAAALDGLPELKLLDMVPMAAVHSDGPVCDPRLWFLGRFPYGEAFTRRMAQRLVGLVLAATGRTVRLLALDLDNTLWGGVLGEDGLAGLAVGGDYPGNAFQAFQRGLKMLSERGIALALLSKNDDDIALKALAELPAMVLRPSDFVARRINWAPKWRNVAELCGELSLGPASVLFIDDNPAEREQMRRNQPEVRVLELPPDPAQFLPALLESPWLECLTLTDEDRKRAASYQSRAALLEAKASSGANAEEFYASLGTHIFMQHFGVGNAARALQLLQKTNQFNTTTRRHGLADIEQLIAGGDEVFVIGLQDCFSEFENIGLLVVRWHCPEHGWGTIDSYLLSCRVLGRGIEAGIVHWVLAQARCSGMRGLVGEVVETPRNTPARGVFAKAGFMAAGAGKWRFDLSTQTEQIPSWLTIVEGPPHRR